MDIDIHAAAEAAAGTVVGVSGRHRQATGTWIATGRVLTAAHNVRGSTAVVHDGVTHPATIVAASGEVDLAVLAVEGVHGTPIRWGDPSGLNVGDRVVALASPDGVLRATAGRLATVSATIRTASGSPLVGALEHTAQVPPGASGGPVLDAQGGVVGIALNRLGGGLYQAARADAWLQQVVADLAEGRRPVRRRLGVAVVPDGRARHMRAAVGLEPREGVLLAGVDDDGPSAGLLARGDLLVAIGDTPLRRGDDLLVALRTADGAVDLSVARGDGPTRTVAVAVA